MVISSSPSCAASTAVDRSWHHTRYLSFYSPHIDMKPTIFSPKYTICPLKLMHLIWNFFISVSYTHLLLVLSSYGWHQSIFLSHTTKISRGCFQKEKLSFNKGNDVIRCNYSRLSGCPCYSQAPSARKNWEEYAKAWSSLKFLFI